MLLAILWALLCGPVAEREQTARAQKKENKPGWDETNKPPKPRPTPHKTPRPTPRSTPRPTPRPSLKPPLSVQYRLFKVSANNSQTEVNRITIFNRGDKIRFSVKPNQDVYLYIIHQKRADQAGKIYFPDSQMSGQNLLPKDKELVIPYGCAPGPPPSDCSYAVDGNVGPEYFTMIFSRDPNINLLNNEMTMAGEIKPQTLDEYAKKNSGHRAGRGDSVYGWSVTNLDRNANQELVVRYVLSKK